MGDGRSSPSSGNGIGMGPRSWSTGLPLPAIAANGEKGGSNGSGNGGAGGHPSHLKYLSLICLVLQNSSLVLVMRYARTVEGPMFFSSTAVALAEMLKVIGSALLLLWEEKWSVRAWKSKVYSEILAQPLESCKLLVPSALYTIQNNLQYVAVSNLDAATFQVTYQMKILTTAMFSVLVLNRKLSGMQWFSLLILTLGVALVQLPPDVMTLGIHFDDKPNQNTALGFTAVFLACLMSGFAGVYFEKILKGSEVSVWVRNIQLGFFGSILALGGAYFKDGDLIHEHGFFYGYQFVTWLAVLNQALGGLLVAVVIKYADNILKGYATSISIIVSSVCSVYLFDFVISAMFIIGSTLVIAATFLYA